LWAPSRLLTDSSLPPYTGPVRTLPWTPGVSPAQQLRELTAEASTPGVLVVRFRDAVAVGPLPWGTIEPWLRSRAVTVADVGGALGGGALEVALCCDLVFVRAGAALDLPAIDSPPGAGLLWAAARAGHGALARVLLDGGSMRAREAVQVGLAHEVVGADAGLPLPEAASIAALTSARDLMRSRADGSAGRALELATFRLLFAAGDPEEGARAFLERRAPRFGAEPGSGRGRGE
jgi:hypothetical protein